MTSQSDSTKGNVERPGWYSTLSKYEQPDLQKAVWQLINTFIPYLLLWYLMYYTLQVGYSYWVTFALAVVAAGLLVRIFIFFHDCCHGSFFASRKANIILGYICGILTFTPFDNWRHSHAVHHATFGNLDRRGIGDVRTLTVDEYLALSRRKQLEYQFFRNPFVMFGLGPVYLFLLSYRFPDKKGRKRDRRSIYITDFAIIAIMALASVTLGFEAYVLIQLPVVFMAGSIGLWLFYVQHQFEGVYWARYNNWDPLRAALEGSSYYKLPKILQWFTGNIGFHDIHHIRPRIPNYNLQSCCSNIPAFQKVKPLTLGRSLKSLRLNLWDEKVQKLVGFRSLKGENMF